jgi:protein gp88
MIKLKFGKGNAKLNKTIHTFSLPAGWTCPGARDCKSKVHVDSSNKRTLKDGAHTKFRCFAASQEVLYTNTHLARQHNFELLKGLSAHEMAELIEASLPKRADTNRVHVSGDFFSQDYFDAWLAVALSNPHRLFYAYTKSLNYWVARMDIIPDNFILTASKGGNYDHLIDQHGLRQAIVVFSEAEAEALGLPIDKDDSHAMKHGGDFALLLHGAQPKDSQASVALQKLKKAGKGGYGRKLPKAS